MGYDPEKCGARCSLCPLGKERNPVPPILSKTPKLAIVGMAPGRREVNMKQPFVGPSGKILDAVLGEASFDRDDAHITNAVLCFSHDDKQIDAAIPYCAPRLANELAELPQQVPILALGGPALKATLGRSGILKARGFVWRATTVSEAAARLGIDERIAKIPRNVKATCGKVSDGKGLYYWKVGYGQGRKVYIGRDKELERLKELRPDISIRVGQGVAHRKIGGGVQGDVAELLPARLLRSAREKLDGRIVIPSVHPAFLLRGADTWRPIFVVDVKRAVRWANGETHLEDEEDFVEADDAATVKSTLAAMKSVVAVDVETTGPDPMHDRLTCVGISDGDTTLVINPWRKSHAGLLAQALKRRTVITHNGPGFDEIVLARYGVTYKNKHDTLIAHHAFASHLPHSLAHVASVYCDTGPWKIYSKSKGFDEKGGGFGVKDDQLAAYNASDVRLDVRCWRRMQPDLRDERKVYEDDMRLAALCQKMQIAGMRVDVARRDELSRSLRRRAAALKGEMRLLTGKKSFSPSKLGDIRQALFGRLKAPRLFFTKSGLVSTSSATLEALKPTGTRAGELADMLLRWRAAMKTASTFLDALNVDRHSRVHPSWRAFGTVSGRLSCRAPNLQNLPRWSDALEDKVREIYVASKGHVFVYFDLSQSEMRAAAYISGDEAFIKTCESGDVHSGNASILFPAAAEIIKKDPKGAGKKFRDITKNAGFGILYLAETETIFAFLRSKGFDVELDEVVAMFDYIKLTYRRYYQYVEENIARCKKVGNLRTVISGRIRWLGWFPRPTDVANAMVQSFIADVMNERLLAIDAALPKGARLVAQVHDSGIFEVKESRVDEVKGLIERVWKKPIFVPTSGKSFVMPIDSKVGDRWSTLG